MDMIFKFISLKINPRNQDTGSAESSARSRGVTADSPILLVPYMWIGDFVRCHSVVKLLRARWPDRPVDLLTNTLCAPLLDYMPSVRKGIVSDLPRRRLPLGQYRNASAVGRPPARRGLWHRPRDAADVEIGFGAVFAGIPERVGFVGEARFGLLSDLRWGERKLERMIDRCGALALPKGAPLPVQWPLPELRIPPNSVEDWRVQHGVHAEQRPIITLSPGAVGAGKAWPAGHYGQLARALAKDGASVWVPGRSERDAAGQANCRGRRTARARPHQQRSAQRHIGARGDRRFGHQRFRLDAYIRRHRHADGRDFSTDQSVAPEAAQSARRHPRAARRRGSPPVRRIEGNDAVAHRRTDDVAVETVLATVREVLQKGR